MEDEEGRSGGREGRRGGKEERGKRKGGSVRQRFLAAGCERGSRPVTTT